MKLKCFITCSIICCLVLLAASVAVSAPFKIYDESPLGGGAGNIYYFGGVFDGTAYVGHIGHGAQRWGDEQIGGTACLNVTNNLLPLSPNNVAKAALPLGGWIYMSNGAGNLCRVKNWSDAVAPQELPSPVLMSDGNPVYCDCITTDGTYIYVSTGTGAITGPYNTVYKYSVNHEAGTISLVWQSAPAGSTTSTHRFRALSYYNGKLYTSNNKGATVGHIFEIDCATGAFTDIATMDPTGVAGDPYQVVRYGNQMFAVSLTDELYTFNYSGGVWTQTSRDALGVGDLYGIAVKGDGTTAKYAWITHTGGAVSFWDLSPQFTTVSLGDARKAKNGYPVVVGNVAVTKLGTGEYWVEDKDRSAGARVICIGELPALNSVLTLMGGMSTTDSGEKVFNPISLNPVGSYTIEPLFLNNKSMGRATGSAGLANDGMLVKVSGKASYFDPNTLALYVDDGSNVTSGIAGVKGVKVTTADMMSVPGMIELITSSPTPPYPYEVVVTGIVRLEKLGDGTIIRRIDARSEADFSLTPLF